MAMAVTGSTTVAYQSASLAHRRIGAHAVGLVIGAVIGVAGAGAMWMALDFLVSRGEQSEWLHSRWFNGVVLLAMIVWMITVIAIGGLVTSAIL